LDQALSARSENTIKKYIKQVNKLKLMLSQKSIGSCLALMHHICASLSQVRNNRER